MLTTAVVLALAGFAAALPTSKERFEARQARRAAGTQRRTNPAQITETDVARTNGTAHVDYSSNWTGAVQSRSTATWTAVTGTFTVPTPKKPSGGSSSTTYSASAWVGIDGDSCSSAILQTGLDFNVRGTTVSYDAWYEWYPDYAYDFTGITFSAGDSVTTTVTATSKTSGSAVIKNNSKGTTVTHTFTGESNALCEYDAEWIVEDFSQCSGSSCTLVPLANWGTVTFTGAQATSASGTTGPAGGTIIDLRQNGQVLSSVSTTSNSVTIQYTGN